MKMSACFILFASLLVGVVLSHAALAQSLIGPMTGGLGVGAGVALSAASQKPMGTQAMIARLQQMGYREVSADPANKNQYFVTERNGMLFKLTLEPLTGQIISAMPR